MTKIIKKYENLNISLDVWQKSLKNYENLNISLDVWQKWSTNYKNLNISLDVWQKETGAEACGHRTPDRHPSIKSFRAHVSRAYYENI